MKKINSIVIVLVLITSFSCKQTKKETKEGQDVETTENAAVFSIVEDSTKVHFTAYKTTDRLGVGGDFLKANLDYDPASGPKEVIDGLEFSIPVSSLFTNDATNVRDPKILKFFFEVMADTEFLKGKISVQDDHNCTAKLTMNGMTKDLPLTYTFDGNKADFTGTIDLKNWDALDALASLNKACEILHTGSDGVSKTWEDVAVNVSLLFEEK